MNILCIFDFYGLSIGEVIVFVIHNVMMEVDKTSLLMVGNTEETLG
jgi:hypothetical protein